MKVQYQDCWAKTVNDDLPGISVRDHCLNVGCVAEALLDCMIDRVRELLSAQGCATLAALHDIGKVSPGFQQKCTVVILSATLTTAQRRQLLGTGDAQG